MDEPNLSLEIDRALVEFENWRGVHGQADVELFIKERGLESHVSEGLRRTFFLEKKLQQRVADQRIESNGGNRPTDLSGKVMGNFRFVRGLGAGGMGDVWLAEQEAPVQRQVAIKLIRSGMDSELFVQRFEAERQALAMMAHPHIAKVLDAGSFENGRPYFVMEYVPGTPITNYCAEHRLSLNQRLELFLQLCDAIQHAHQKSLLHRDIKPTNVLVTEVDGRPHLKVIDFGLAKVFSDEAQRNPRITQVDSPLGSPLWMSPEQANGRRGADDAGVDTRSDIYSLGVVLYQLLTNSTPITEDFYGQASPGELLEAIQEQIPPYPSIRLRETKDWVEQHTTSSYSSWSSMLRNDLDWVTMKALEKERERRYPTVTALADDIRRFINSEPVIARPPSTVYRIKKVIRKHRVIAVATVVVATSLLAATIVLAWLAMWALNERAIANLERSRAEQLVGFVFREFDKLNVSNPGVQYDEFKLGFLLSLRDEIDRTDFADDALTESSLHCVLGRSLSGSGRPQDAIDEFGKAIAICEQKIDAEDDLLISAHTLLAFEFLKLRKTQEAIASAAAGLAISVGKYGNNHELSIGAEIALNSSRLQQGELNTVILSLEPLVQRARGSLGESHPYVIEAMAVLADAFHKQQKYEVASELFDSARKLAAELWGKDYQRTMELDALYWEACARDFRFQKSPEELREFLDRTLEKFGPGHPFTLTLKDHCGGILLQQGKTNLALEIYQENLEACEKYLGEDHLQTIAAMQSLAMALRQLREYDRAQELTKKSVAKFASILGEQSAEVFLGHYFIGQIHFNNNEFDKSFAVAEKYIPDAERCLGRDNRTTVDLLDLKARSLVELGQIETAISIFEENWNRSCQNHGADSIQSGIGLRRLAAAHSVAGNYEQAIEYYEQASEILNAQCGLRHSETHQVLGMLISLLLQQKQFERAEVYIHQTLDNLVTEFPQYTKLHASAQVALAEALTGQNNYGEAKQIATQLLALNPPEDFVREQGLAKSILAECHVEQGEYETAESLLQEAMETLDTVHLQVQFLWYQTRCLERRVVLYEKWGKPVMAKKYKEQLSAAQTKTPVD